MDDTDVALLLVRVEVVEDTGLEIFLVGTGVDVGLILLLTGGTKRKCTGGTTKLVWERE